MIIRNSHNELHERKGYRPKHKKVKHQPRKIDHVRYKDSALRSRGNVIKENNMNKAQLSTQITCHMRHLKCFTLTCMNI